MYEDIFDNEDQIDYLFERIRDLESEVTLLKAHIHKLENMNKPPQWAGPSPTISSGCCKYKGGENLQVYSGTSE